MRATVPASTRTGVDSTTQRTPVVHAGVVSEPA